MADFRRVTDEFSVASQIALEDLPAAAQAGFVLVINNRPDGESFDQPPGADIEAAAGQAGLAYLAIPVRGGPSREQALEMAQAVQAADGPVLAFCRTGTRSINSWAAGQALTQTRTAAELKALGAEAGYDLSGLFG